MAKIVHTDLITDNPKATADFVGKMFGWYVKKWEDAGEEFYWWNYIDGTEKGGVGGIGQAGKNGPHIDVYVEVEDINATIEKAKSLGATEVRGETEIGEGLGYFAAIQIPGGVKLGLCAKEKSKIPAQKQAVSQQK